MDLNDILTATQTVECEFLGEKISLEVYTAGFQKLTKEQRAPLRALEKNGDPDDLDSYGIDAMRITLPLVVKSWDVTWKGEPLPIEKINDLDESQKRVYEIPDALLVAIAGAVQEVSRARPMEAETSPSGSEPEASASTATN